MLYTSKGIIMTNFIGFKHKPIDFTDERTGEYKHMDRVQLQFVTDKHVDYYGMYAFEHVIEFVDLEQIVGCTEEELRKRFDTHKTKCIVEAVALKNGKQQLTEVHWLEAL